MPTAYLQQLRQLISDPTSNLVGAALGVSIVVILLVIFVLTLLFFAVSPSSSRSRKAAPSKAGRKRKPPTPEQIARRKARVRRARIVTWSIVVVGVFAAWIALFVGTSVNSYCGNTCHSMVQYAGTWKESPHASVRCVRCHEGDPKTTLVTASISRLKSVVHAVTSTRSPGIALPPSRCLSCHESVMTRTVVTDLAVKMSHKEPIEAGATCSDCHGAQGHLEQALIIGMSACLRCHDGVTASTECVTCHPKGIEASIREPERETGVAVRLPAKPTCGGCHSQKSCDDCHGLRMPHPADFGEPKRHASLAAFERKERLCYRCHARGECLQCHASFPGHTAGWKSDHVKYADADGRRGGYCLWCHDTEDFCGLCH